MRRAPRRTTAGVARCCHGTPRCHPGTASCRPADQRVARVVVDADDVGQALRDRQRVALIARLPPLGEPHRQRGRQVAVHQDRPRWIGLSDGLDFAGNEARIQTPRVLHARADRPLRARPARRRCLGARVALDDARDELRGRRQERRVARRAVMRVSLGQWPRQVVRRDEELRIAEGLQRPDAQHDLLAGRSAASTCQSSSRGVEDVRAPARCGSSTRPVG